jgi:hypothetical protein
VKLQNLENKDYVKTLSDREHLTEDFVDSFVNHYLKDVVDGSQKEGGWPNWTDWVNSPFGRPVETYSISKVQSLLMSVPCITFLLPNLEVETRSMPLAAALVLLPQILITIGEQKLLKKVLIPQYD